MPLSQRRSWTVLTAATIAAAGLGAQPVRPADGPTRLAIAAGTVTDAQSRAGLLGVWEPDADLGAEPGASQLTYFADGLYLTPLRNITLVGLWDATARSLTLTPIEVRNLASGDVVPEMKEALAQIAWGKTDTSLLTWVDPDRYRESGSQYGRRRRAISECRTWWPSARWWPARGWTSAVASRSSSPAACFASTTRRAAPGSPSATAITGSRPRPEDCT